ELRAALGNDPGVIAECLARPALVNRLIRTWYAADERYHGALKRRAGGGRRSYATPGQIQRMSGEYRELEWVKRGAQEESGPGNSVALGSEQWDAKVRELARLFAEAAETGGRLRGALQRDAQEELDRLPLGELSPLREEEDRFTVATILKKSEARLKIARVTWKKEAFDGWWNRAQGEIRGKVAEPTYAYHLAEITPNSAADDTWTGTAAPPDLRHDHTAVWTGSEMIVWGGYPKTNTGARYDPATDTWTPISTLGAPSARELHRAVWTGTEMLVWGGLGTTDYLATGGRYDPASDSWMPISTLGAPSARDGHTAMWTGT